MDRDESDPANGQYNDTNRAFLQAFLARGSLTLTEGKALLAAIFTANDGTETRVEDVTEEDLNSYISAAADAISPYDYEIRSTQHQITKKRTFALVNSNSDALTQLATTRTPEEILYIRRLLDGMFDSLNRKGKEIMAITGMQAIQSAIRKGSGKNIMGDGTQSIDKGVTQDQVEKLLEQLVNENWLERSKAGFYSLSPRALMELRHWLVITYNDEEAEAEADEWQRIKTCEACRDIITVGQRCSNMDCHVRLHNICETAYFNSRPAKNCPRCKTPWAGNRFVGEKAVTTTDDYLKGKRRSGRRVQEEVEEVEEDEPVGRKRKGARVPQTQEAASEEEAGEEESEPSARRKRSRRARNQSSEEEDAEGEDDD